MHVFNIKPVYKQPSTRHPKFKRLLGLQGKSQETLDKVQIKSVTWINVKLNQQRCGNDFGLDFNSELCILFVIILVVCYVHVF